MFNNYISYNSNQIPYPTPLVELSRENVYENNHLGFVDFITLKGQLTGNFQQLQTGQSGLLNTFNNNFGVFEIFEATTQPNLFQKIYEKSGIVIKSISFDESTYNGALGYTIQMSSSTMSGNVINPINEYNFTENKDKTISLSHNVSAKGINTSKYPSKSNALQNAISFVNLNTGLANVPTVKFISGANNKFYLQTISESIDRLNGIYSISERYSSDLLNTGISGVLSYSFSISSGAESNALDLSIKGTYKGGIGENINNLRESLSVTRLVSGLYPNYFNPIPIQYNITENTGENSINFDYSFDNINLPNPYILYEINVSRDEIEQINRVDINGNIIARGNKLNKYTLSKNLQSTLTGGFSGVALDAANILKDFNNNTGNFNLRLVNIELIDNPNEGTLSAKASYDDKPMPADENIADSSFQVSVEAPNWYMTNIPTANKRGLHIVNDFDVTTLPKANIQVSLAMTNNSLTRSGAISQAAGTASAIIPTQYNFDKTLQNSYSIEEVSGQIKQANYKLQLVSTLNTSSLFPKITT